VKRLILRSKKFLTILATLLIVTVSASVLVAYVSGYIWSPSTSKPTDPPNRSFETFTLTVAGTAYDTVQQKTILVALSSTGNAQGKLGSSVQLSVGGGAATTRGYQTFSVSKGTRTITTQAKNVHMEITLISSPYGGKSTVWTLQGKTGYVAGDTEQVIQVTFTGNNVKLPFDTSPTLQNLVLTGTLTLR
jgi:hypothetical protein